MRFLAFLAAAALATTLGATSAVQAVEPADLDGDVATNGALADAVESAAEIPVDVGAADVIDASLAGVQVVVPSDPTDPVLLGAEAGASFEVMLPALDNLGEAEMIDGTVAYQSADASIVPVVHEDGTLQILAVLASAEAPTTYPYEFGFDGGRIEPLADGGFVLLDDRGDELARAAAPWAIDADGQEVPTHYQIDGTTVSQVVEPAPDATYPIAADPAITVTTYEYKVVGLTVKKSQPNFRLQLGYCQAATANTVCTIRGSYEVERVVSGTLGVSVGWVTAQIGMTGSEKVKGSMSCMSPRLPAGAFYRAFSMGTYYFYTVQKWKIVKSGGRTVRSLDAESSQIAYHPDHGVYCVQR